MGGPAHKLLASSVVRLSSISSTAIKLCWAKASVNRSPLCDFFYSEFARAKY